MSRLFKITVCIALLLAILLPTHFASAHVLKVDGSIGSTLHVDPADNPVVGSPATFYFEIKDKQNKFTPTACNCTVSISTSEGEVLHTEQLFTQSSSAGLSNPLLQYVFEKGGVYTVTLTGSPKTAGGFQSFQLSYTVRVENGEPTPHTDNAETSVSDAWLYSGLGLLVVVGFVLIAWQRKKKSKHSSALLVLFGVFASANMLFYAGHFFELATPAPVHHHTAHETGHVEKGFHATAPHTTPLAVTHAFVGSEHVLSPLFLRPAPVALAFVPALSNTRAPPLVAPFAMSVS